MGILKKIYVLLCTILCSFLIAFNVDAVTSTFYNYSDYAGQRPIGVLNFSQGRVNLDNSRTTAGMKGNFINEIGLKTKLFTSGSAPSFYESGLDVNGDGKENLLYGFGGKLYLGDISSGLVLWETKVLDVKSLLGIEDVLLTGVKSIVVLLGEDRYLGIIDGETGELTRTSHFANGPVQKIKVSWPSFERVKFDVDGDGINEYHFKQRYKKYHSMKLYASGSTVLGETLYSSEGYGNYNEGSDGYQPSSFSVGSVSGKDVVGTKGSNTFAFYSTDVDETQTGTLQYKMPAFGKWWVGGNSGNGRSGMTGYFYDINLDGNDEFIARIAQETNNNKLSRIIIGGIDGSGSMVQYNSIAYPRELDEDGLLVSNGNYSVPLALRNYSDLSDSYVLTYGRDPLTDTDRRMMLKYDGLDSSGWKKTSSENETFNENIVYDTLPSGYDVAGIYNNGQRDFVVLRKSSSYYFYNFTGTGTFQTESNLVLPGSFYGNSLFDRLDPTREKNRSGMFMSGYDIDGNGLKEFVVTDGGFFKFYEITTTGVTLRYTFGAYNSIPGVKKWGMTDDFKDMYAVTYDSTLNTINYYRTNSDEGEYSFVKQTSDTFYSGGQVQNIAISKLGLGTESYNRLMISGKGMYDARNATPNTSPVKIGSDYYSKSYDVDGDGINEVYSGGKAYTFNSPGDITLKYNGFGDVGDINGDGVLDSARSYCASSENYASNVFVTIRDGKTGEKVVPDLDWGNGNGYCAGGRRGAFVAEDYDNDGYDEFAIGTMARSTRLVNYDPDTGTVTQGNQLSVYSSNLLQAFDVNGDGVKEILRGHDKSAIFYGSGTSARTLTYKNAVDPGVKSTWGTSLGIPALYNDSINTYFAYRGADGEVALSSYNIESGTVTNLFKNYYITGEKYSDSDSVLNNNLIPLATADVLVGDFLGNNTVSVLVGGGDGGVYVLDTDGEILRYFNVGSAIRRIVYGDVNNSGYLSVFVSSEDGYIYQLTNSNLSNPTWVKDGPNYGYDIETQTSNKKVNVNYSKISKATGYFVQLYNKTEKSVVFDWVDVGDVSRACVVSQEVTDSNCFNATKSFSLNGKSIYEWRVQAYNDNVTSAISTSNGFSVLNLNMSKVVAKKEDLNFADEITVSPNTLLTYKITVENDSLNTVGGAGYMNYDMTPPQSVSSCDGVTDCRTKNLTISDYMPTTFTYMPNSTIWIIKKISYDGSEEILNGGSQVSDGYFTNQEDTTLTTNPGATLIWQFPSTVAIPAGAYLELQFDAIAKNN